MNKRRDRASDLIFLEPIVKTNDGDSDFYEFSGEPYMYEPESSDCQSDFSNLKNLSPILNMVIVFDKRLVNI